jgi:hypothetical protein
MAVFTSALAAPVGVAGIVGAAFWVFWVMVTVLAADQADSAFRLSRAWAFTEYCPAAAQLRA